MNARTYDLVIIGAGPTGLYAAFYAGLRQLKTLIVDSLDLLGGQLATLYPEKYIYDVAGFPKVLAKDLADRLIEQAMRHSPDLRLGEQVERLDDHPDRGFLLKTSTGICEGRAILVAAGAGAFHPRRLPVPNADFFHGKGLHYFVSQPEAFRSKRILIVGGGDSAVDWATTLTPLAADLTLIHRRDTFRAQEQNLADLRRSRARILPFHELRNLGGQNQIESATIFDNRTGDEQTLPVDAVLANIGFESSLGHIRHWGIDLEGAAIKVDHQMQTSRPGIFAAGDVATYPGKLKLLSVAFGEAAIAVNHIKHLLDPRANLFPGHSTNLIRDHL